MKLIKVDGTKSVGYGILTKLILLIIALDYFHCLIDQNDTITYGDLQEGYNRTFICWSRVAKNHKHEIHDCNTRESLQQFTPLQC